MSSPTTSQMVPTTLKGPNVLFEDAHVKRTLGNAPDGCHPDYSQQDPHAYTYDDGGLDDASIEEDGWDGKGE